jgi:hypothetical protein
MLPSPGTLWLLASLPLGHLEISSMLVILCPLRLDLFSEMTENQQGLSHKSQ